MTYNLFIDLSKAFDTVNSSILYKNYLGFQENNIKTDTTIFADDTTLICSGKNKEDLKSNIVSNLINAET